MLGVAPPVPLVVVAHGSPLPLSFSYPSTLRCRKARTAAAAKRGGGGKRRWWSDPDDYESSSLDEEEEDDGNDDYEDGDEAPFSSLGSAGELFDEPWFSKVFNSYGYLLPVILVSMLVANGPRAFLMAIAIPLGQSAISFVLNAIWGRRRSNRNDRWRWQAPPFQEEEEDYPEYSSDFTTGGQGGGGGSSNSYHGGRRQQSYQSWDSDDLSAGADGNGNNTETTSSSSSSSRGGGFGGWDELLVNQEKVRSDSFSAPVEEVTDGGGKGLGATAAPPPPARRGRRRRMPRTMGRYKQAPLLMRLLVAVFPFLGSWLRLL